MSHVASPPALDLQRIRQDFPILSTLVRGKPLVYLDNAATSQKPVEVLNAVDAFYSEANSNVHRGVHFLSAKATAQYEGARVTVRRFLNADSTNEIIFTKGCTESINLVASALSTLDRLWLGAGKCLKEGDVVLLSQMEHHSNIVPWQLAAARTGARVKVIPMFDNGELDLQAYERILRAGSVKVVGVVHVSNSLGTVNPVKEMVRLAHEHGALVVIDGAQAGPHQLVDVQDLDADFYTLSCHKIYAPTGVGVLYGKRELLQAIPPYQGGGDMIRTVDFEGSTYADPPARFEAGTPNVGGVIGLGAAIDYLAKLGAGKDRPDTRAALAQGFDLICAHETSLARRAEAQLREIPGLRITGEAKNKSAIVSFTLEGAHPHDIGTILDGDGVAVRAGHHCCMPLMKRLGVPATVRASFAFYNTEEEVDKLIESVKKVKEMFG